MTAEGQRQKDGSEPGLLCPPKANIAHKQPPVRFGPKRTSACPIGAVTGLLDQDSKDTHLWIHFHLSAIGDSCGDIFSKPSEHRYIAECGALRENGVH